MATFGKGWDVGKAWEFDEFLNGGMAARAFDQEDERLEDEDDYAAAMEEDEEENEEEDVEDAAGV